MRTGSTATAIALLALLPGAQAGTESTPQIADVEGDVAYSDYYPYGGGHDYLDVLAAWWTYDDERDALVFSIKGVDYEAFDEAPPVDHYVVCRLRFDVQSTGARAGFLFIQIEALPADTEYTSSVVFIDGEDDTTVGRPIEHLQRPMFERPGRLEFTLSRASILAHGDQLTNGRVQCREEYFPATDYPLKVENRYVMTNPVTNADFANGTEVAIDLMALVPVPGAAIADCEFDGTCVSATPSPSTSAFGEPPNDTPGASAGLAFLAAGAAILLSFIRGRRSPPAMP